MWFHLYVGYKTKSNKTKDTDNRMEDGGEGRREDKEDKGGQMHADERKVLDLR